MQNLNISLLFVGHQTILKLAGYPSYTITLIINFNNSTLQNKEMQLR